MEKTVYIFQEAYSWPKHKFYKFCKMLNLFKKVKNMKGKIKQKLDNIK